MNKNSLKYVSIVIPAYNEENNIPILLDKMDNMFKKSGIDAEVILVNDGSTDATGQQIKDCLVKYPFVKVIEHAYNRGLTQSLADGFLKSTGQLLVFFPADLQYLPEDIPKLLSGFEKGYDVVTGWKQGHYNKRFISTLYNYLSHRLFHVDVHDLNSIKAMKRKVVDSLILSCDWHRYLVVLAASKGFKIGEVKINVYPRKFGKSKFGFSSVPIGIIDLVIVKIYTVFSHKPSLLFGLISSIFLIFGGAILSSTFICFLTKKDFLLGVSVKTWLLFVSILFVAGILFLLIGYIAELITHLDIRLQRLSKHIRKQE